jgi:hypothetical protein
VVRAYLAQLKALPAASRDQAITNLVLALAPLGQSRAANAAFRRELAQAVREVAKLASTPQQVASLQNIAGGIERGSVQTAAVPETLGSDR